MAEEKFALKNHFLKILRHMKWADLSVLDFLEEKKITSGRAVELLSHILIAEDTWYRRITNDFYDNQFWKVISLEECKRMVEQTNSKFVQYILGLHEDDFLKKISYKNSKGIDYTTSVEDIITHIGLLGMYHRGQIMQLMRNLVNDVVATDYAMYIREHEYGEDELI